MLFIKELNTKLNTQKDSIRAKLFKWHYMQTPYCISYSFIILSLSYSVTSWVSKESIYIYIQTSSISFTFDLKMTLKDPSQP